jgi:DNA-binding MarR family transcriptional regulator
MKPLKTAERDEDILDEINRYCLLTRTHRISRIVTNLYDRELRPFGVNSHQFSLLVVIFRIGPASRAEIGRFNHQERSTMTRNLKVVLAEGWVEEVSQPAGGRGRPIVLTQAGKDLLHRALPSWRHAQAQAKALLGEAGVLAITDIANGL